MHLPSGHQARCPYIPTHLSTNTLLQIFGNSSLGKPCWRSCHLHAPRSTWLHAKKNSICPSHYVIEKVTWKSLQELSSVCLLPLCYLRSGLPNTQHVSLTWMLPCKLGCQIPRKLGWKAGSFRLQDQFCSSLKGSRHSKMQPLVHKMVFYS